MKNTINPVLRILSIALVFLAACSPKSVEGKVTERTFDVPVSLGPGLFSPGDARIFPPDECFNTTITAADWCVVENWERTEARLKGARGQGGGEKLIYSTSEDGQHAIVGYPDTLCQLDIEGKKSSEEMPDGDVENTYTVHERCVPVDEWGLNPEDFDGEYQPLPASAKK